MEDIDIAQRYLIINLVIKNLELDLQHVKNGPFKIKDPYVHIVQGIISKAINERRELQRLMYQRKIQVEFLYTQGHFTTYKFILDKQIKEKTFMSQILKRNVEDMMTELMKREQNKKPLRSRLY